MVISIVRFMSDYYGISLDAGYMYSHKVLKKSFKELKRCSFKYADSNPELVGSGKIIYVKDSYGQILPYICPKRTLISNEECRFTEAGCENDNANALDELVGIPTYVLGELLSKYKNKPSFYKLIKTELVNRGVYSDKIYRCARELTDEIHNDKFMRRRKIRIKKMEGGKND